VNGWTGRLAWIVISALIGAAGGIAASRLDVESRMVRVETVLDQQKVLLERINERQLRLIQDTSFIKARLTEE